MTLQADFLDELREDRARLAAFDSLEELRAHYLEVVRAEMRRRAEQRYRTIGPLHMH